PFDFAEQTARDRALDWNTATRPEVDGGALEAGLSGDESGHLLQGVAVRDRLGKERDHQGPRWQPVHRLDERDLRHDPRPAEPGGDRGGEGAAGEDMARA